MGLCLGAARKLTWWSECRGKLRPASQRQIGHETVRVHAFPIGGWPGSQWTIWLDKEIARIYFAARRCRGAKKGPRSLPQRTIDGARVPKSSYDRLLKDCRLLAPEEGKSVGFVEYLKSCFNISAPRKLDFALWGLRSSVLTNSQRASIITRKAPIASTF